MYKIQVAVPVPLARNFTYLYKTLLPRGVRVRVPFGTRKMIGMVLGEADGIGLDGVELKAIDEVLDETPILSPTLLKLGSWVSQYYLHPIGEVFKTMLPTAEKKKVRDLYILEQSGGLDFDLLSFLFKKKQTVSSVVLKKRLKEWLVQNPQEDANVLKKLLKQGVIRHSKDSYKDIKKTVLHDPVEQNLSRRELHPLNSEQESVVHRILESMTYGSKTFLLHGVTGSGKTRVYLSVLHGIFERLGASSQALILVPEIALTPQMTRIFEESFPGQVAVVHSVLSDAQRWSELSRIREGNARILIGPRSAVFASFKHLGLIVVDEEHDTSYKQQSGLTYNGRDLAVVRARMEAAVCILGSATPSIESYWNASLGKYEYLELKNRAVDLPLPKVRIVPSVSKIQKESLHDEDFHEDLFLSPQSLEALKENYERGQQAIVLVNRRGYAYYLFNHDTKKPIECPECSISLTVHKNRTKLICHYCGYQSSVADILAKFPQSGFSVVGIGSQKAEAILKRELPQVKIGRLDSDVLTSREKLFPILSEFRKGETQILVGTQMIAKGHDFPNVGLTVICELDAMLDIPDFRAGERSFQLIVQAAGRAGRFGQEGQVILQSLREKDPVLQYALHHDYAGFVQRELELRKQYAYPPFSHLIRLEFSSTSTERLDEFCANIVQWQQGYFARNPAFLRDARIIGPVSPPIERIKSRFRRVLLLSSENLERVHRLAYDFLASFPHRKGDVRIQVDVDPQSLL